MEKEKQKKIGQMQDSTGKCRCSRCGKKMLKTSFYTYRDGSKCEICKPCLTAHIDNFNPQTFEWILEKMDVPYIPSEWNNLRDKAFAQDPYKMNGMSVIGKYLAKMKLNQWRKYTYADTEKLLKEAQEQKEKEAQAQEEERKRYQAELKVQLSEGKITEAQYQTLVSTETQNKQLPYQRGNVITGQHGQKAPSSYNQALGLIENPFQEQNFISENDLISPDMDLTQEDKMYLAIKWGRLYRPYQWVALEQLYNEFMKSFQIQGAARIDTLKMICKTSLKMNQAIDSGDIDTYQKLSRVYDSMMKSAKFTEAQNKNKSGQEINSASAIVDFVQKNSGAIPRYRCDVPRDIVDQIIADLKEYNRNLIYEDKSLAQEIQKYLQDKRIAEEMKRDKYEAKAKGLDAVQLQDKDYIKYRESLLEMKQHDNNLNQADIEKEYQGRRLKQL